MRRIWRLSLLIMSFADIVPLSFPRRMMRYTLRGRCGGGAYHRPSRIREIRQGLRLVGVRVRVTAEVLRRVIVIANVRATMSGLRRFARRANNDGLKVISTRL